MSIVIVVVIAAALADALSLASNALHPTPKAIWIRLCIKFEITMAVTVKSTMDIAMMTIATKSTVAITSV